MVKSGNIRTERVMHAEQLTRLHPGVNVRADVLYVDEGQVLTSAGKTAVLDLCLHLVHRDHGASAANGLARRLVVASHRPGGQAQFVAPPPDPRATDRIEPALDWARAHLDKPLTVQDLARESGLSTRQLARRMRAETGLTPLGWLHQQRITRAQDLLERHRSAPCHGHVGAAVLAEEDLLEPVFLNGGQVLERLRSRNRPEVYKQDLRTVGREVFQKPREPMPRTCETLCRIHSCIRAAGKTCPTTSRPRRKLIPPQNLR
jgi:AraC-like DNA-binding protein